MTSNVSTAIDELSPWFQRIDFGNGVFSPGKWDASAQAHQIDEWMDGGVREKSVIDVGSNAGGVGFALAELGAKTVTLVENSPRFHKQAELYIASKSPPGVVARQESAFRVHELPTADVVLWLGLFYHFRHPQLFLDYAASCGGELHVISTQTKPGDDEMEMRNRKLVYPNNPAPAMGWEPTQDMFESMLKLAGYEVLQTHATKWGEGWTNDLYCLCRPPREPKFDADALASAMDAPGNWF